eukprot:765528-Hanusia_phi.AAC.5
MGWTWRNRTRSSFVSLSAFRFCILPPEFPDDLVSNKHSDSELANPRRGSPYGRPGAWSRSGAESVPGPARAAGGTSELPRAAAGRTPGAASDSATPGCGLRSSRLRRVGVSGRLNLSAAMIRSDTVDRPIRAPSRAPGGRGAGLSRAGPGPAVCPYSVGV